MFEDFFEKSSNEGIHFEWKRYVLDPKILALNRAGATVMLISFVFKIYIEQFPWGSINTDISYVKVL